MIDRIKHEQILKNILKDIYLNPNLQSSMGFKGGTCLYIFYGLDRFSVDLDFNLLSNSFNPEFISDIVSKYLNIEENRNKQHTWFWIGSYEKGKQKIKVEINKRDYPDDYVNKDFYGLTIPTMSPSSMFSHKLCAITDRKKLQNRDLYDANFMFSKGFDINEEIIKIRTNKSINEYLKELTNLIETKKDTINILEGLGELISESQKDRAKNTLLKELLININMYISNHST